MHATWGADTIVCAHICERNRMNEIVTLRHFAPDDLPALVAFWNEALGIGATFARLRRRPTAHTCWRTLHLTRGLLLAWRERGDETTLVGMAHAFRPAPQEGLAAAWGEGHTLALLYVRPDPHGKGWVAVSRRRLKTGFTTALCWWAGRAHPPMVRWRGIMHPSLAAVSIWA